ncbi:uncharacterized protein LOC135834386 [Planococcus citri]|uniref:uncharacterized protein LOC135834386 n=1 Tax=Planococcus citri TaxID=170843 RepID=UPI0031F883C0
MIWSSIFLLTIITSHSWAKLHFSPNTLRPFLHEVRFVNLTSDCTLPKDTVIEIFPLPNDKAADIYPRQITVKDSTQMIWSLEINIKGYGVTSFIANVKGNSKPDLSGSVQVKVSHVY